MTTSSSRAGDATARTLTRYEGHPPDYVVLPREPKAVSDAVRRAPRPPVRHLLPPGGIRGASDTELIEMSNRRMALYQLDRDTARTWMT
ncbi:hypothetical protein A5733_13345 [Mycobacterium sp. NS-7484]|uniref:hypothetical protein n=1 Tax=Mycobacterium sp. NS-7484 TaxID=1834161 RepID=UPI00096C99D3|nr:hypothetical protein [Mycobacterium sp. NS-7484]OMB95103.1 hypothetical protein A5733_13345 [Mycobacterium sp. NS-7484]